MKDGMFIKDYFSELMSNTVEEEKLCEMVEKAKDILISAIENHTVCDSAFSLTVDERRVEALENYLHLFENKDYQKVYYYAVIKTISEVMKELADNEKQYQEYRNIHSYKYLYSVLELLSQNNIMEQKRIAEALNISSQSLSNFFRRTNQFHYWSKKKTGKHSLYIITAQGKKAYRFCKMQSFDTENVKQLEEILVTAFGETAKAIKKRNFNGSSYVLHALNTKYSKGMDLFHSPMLKQSLDSVFYNARENDRAYLQANWAEFSKIEEDIDDVTSVLLTNDYYDIDIEM